MPIHRSSNKTSSFTLSHSTKSATVSLFKQLFAKMNSYDKKLPPLFPSPTLKLRHISLKQNLLPLQPTHFLPTFILQKP